MNEALFKQYPFSLDKEKKEKLIKEAMDQLTEYHKTRCLEYKNIVECVLPEEEIPFLPVRLFKELELKSIPENEITKIMTSSGTTGQVPSKIFLNTETLASQQQALVSIVSDFIGKDRMPMLIIDCPSVIRDRKKFSARGAGILGFCVFSTERVYGLNDDMELNIPALLEFAEKYAGKPVLLFGFTYIVWKYFCEKLKEQHVKLDFKEGVLVHGGGWKKLGKEAVSEEKFKQEIEEVTGIRRIYNYYGMVEQTGSIYMECEKGHLHVSNFSDIVVRRGKDFSVCKQGEEGIVQVLSVLPESYPGHSILTEDRGVILGEDDCPCGRKGKYFKITGRIAAAETRGCSDTFEKRQG